MKQVVVCNDYGHVNGGAARVAITAALGLADAGWNVIFFCAVPPVDERLADHDLVEVVCTGQSDILSDPSPARAALRGIWNAEAARALERVLRHLDPATTPVHIHCFTKSLTGSILPTAAKRGFAVCVTLHDYFPGCPTGGLFHHTACTACTYQALSIPCLLSRCDARSDLHKQWRVVRQIFQNRAFRRVHNLTWVYVSDYSRAVLQGRLPTKGAEAVIPNPIDIIKAPPAEPGKGDRFVFVGEIARRKGVFVLAEAAAMAETPVTFVGDGPDRGELEQLHPGVRVTGWLDPDAVAAYVRGSRALVFPSLWHEAQPLAPQEALAAGIPAVVTDGSAARECVVDGETGVIVPGGNAVGLADTLRTLWDDPDLADRLGKAAYERFWADPPTVARHVEDLEKLYRNALSRRTKPEPAA